MLLKLLVSEEGDDDVNLSITDPPASARMVALGKPPVPFSDVSVIATPVDNVFPETVTSPVVPNATVIEVVPVNFALSVRNFPAVVVAPNKLDITSVTGSEVTPFSVTVNVTPT